MHVPMILKFPSEPPSRPFAIHGTHQANGREAGALAQLTDVAPTVLDALGLSSFTQGMQGLSLLPALFETLSPRSAAYAETQSSDVNNRLLAVRDKRWNCLLYTSRCV